MMHTAGLLFRNPPLEICKTKDISYKKDQLFLEAHYLVLKDFNDANFLCLSLLV